MFNFGQTSYVQLEPIQGQGKPHTNGNVPHGSNSSTWNGGGATSGGGIESGGASMGGESGRVQVPIGMVSDTHTMRRWQSVALFAFTLVQVAMFVGLCLACFLLQGLGRVALVAAAGGAWLALLLLNLRLAGRPRQVIQSFLNSKHKTRLSPFSREGSTVVVSGAVSLLHEELLSTEFHNVPGLVLVESSLRSYHPGSKKKDAWTEHVRQTRAVDFRITDSYSGASAIVRAYAASETGAATPLVHVSTEVPLSTAVPLTPPGQPSRSSRFEGAGASPRGVDTSSERKMKNVVAAPQLMVCKGYIRQGQVVTVMGQLTLVAGSQELYISPLPHPHNVSKLLLYRGLLPFFFPTWVSGLVISDQRDLS